MMDGWRTTELLLPDNDICKLTKPVQLDDQKHKFSTRPRGDRVNYRKGKGDAAMLYPPALGRESTLFDPP